MQNFKKEGSRARRTSAGAVILRKENEAWHALVLRAWSHWDFPKGNVEPGESLMETAIREVEEETGIKELSFPWGKAFYCTDVYSKDKVAYYAIAQTDTEKVILEPNPQTNIKEHDEYRWVPWDQIRTYLSPRLACIVEWVENVTKIQQSTQQTKEPQAPRMES